MKNLRINKQNLKKFIDDLTIQDKKELQYFYKNNYKKEFIKTVLNCKNSYFLADENNNPIAIGGVVKINIQNYTLGQVWLLSTNKAHSNRFRLYKYIKNKIEIFKKDYDILFNQIYKSNYDALRWLNECGFRTVELNNKNFKLFYFSKGENNFDIRNITGEQLSRE